MIKWFSEKGYETYGSPNNEVSLKNRGIQALCKLAQSGKTEDWESLETHLGSNGIDIVAFSQSNKKLWIVELKGWTSTPSDFNENIHQIFKRIESVNECYPSLQNTVFACCFPFF